MPVSPILVLGTTNSGKRQELTALLEPFGIACQSLADFPAALAVAETGTTFAENAALKASQQALALGHWVLGEDSGLAVDALGGGPGVYSARFSGPEATDEANNTLLLEKLAGVPADQRTAHYACHAALADPEGTIRATASGRCCGRIADTAAGCGGFGYDPIFIPEGGTLHAAELAPDEKSRVSHRAIASTQLLARLRE